MYFKFQGAFMCKKFHDLIAMTGSHTLLPIVFILFMPFAAYSQADSTDSSTMGQLIASANAYSDSGNYAESIRLLNLIRCGDPEYPRSCYELALDYYQTDRTAEALEKCREAQSLNFNRAPLYSLMGAIYDDMGQTGEGILILKQALEKWPDNQNLLYNLGICDLNADSLLSAEKILIRSIERNPFHTKSHMALGRVNYRMGRIAQAYLAYNMGILINPTVRNIHEFENAISEKTKPGPRGYMYPYPPEYNHHGWDRLRDLLLSGFAFQPGFQFPFDQNYTVTRLTYLLADNLMLIDQDTSIYGRLYARLFEEIMQSGRFGVFLEYYLKNTGDKQVDNWIKANTAQVNDFVRWVQGYLDTCGQMENDREFETDLEN
jgi:tetratricopeptide (TPR) repeat protein